MLGDRCNLASCTAQAQLSIPVVMRHHKEQSILGETASLPFHNICQWLYEEKVGACKSPGRQRVKLMLLSGLNMESNKNKYLCTHSSETQGWEHKHIQGSHSLAGREIETNQGTVKEHALNLVLL